ncbi:MAG: hypothetical protein F4X66_13895 [Chloroflexi bacterium]|nr:hypothetical protein [Chloroflexota bacterium]MYE41892.1 hypothetical protein [Chloroflexota bacterium]
MKRLRIIVALLVAGAILTLAGVVLAQQAGWIAPLVEEYSLIWKDAYDETAKYDLPPAGREAVADRVLDAHIATRATPSSGGAPPPGTGHCIQTINLNATVSGQWPGGCDSKVSGRGHARYYQFTLTQDAEVTVLLESQDAETVLYLREGAGATSGDYLDSNEGDPDYNYRRATIETSLSAATYTIEATTYNAGETGSFTLTVSSVAAVAPTPAPTPGVVTVSDVDGYTSEFRIEIFVSSIGTNLSMSRWNVFTVGGVKVRLDSDGNLTTKGFGLSLADRYSWACNPVNGSTGESRSYASEEYNVGLPKTDLDNAPLLNHSLGRRVSRICSGQETAPSSTVRTTWTEKFSLP